VRFTFRGAGSPRLIGEQLLPGTLNYLRGRDPTRWSSDVPCYSSVSYRGMYPGIDVRLRLDDGHLEFDLILAAGADLAGVELAVEGACPRHAGEALEFVTAAGTLELPPATTWQEGPRGERHPAACVYALRSETSFGFEVPNVRPDWPLVIDPGIEYSTYLGGRGFDYATAIAMQPDGSATIVGHTYSLDYPVTAGAFDTSHNGSWDAVVSRLKPDGRSLVFSTFFGGASADFAFAVGVNVQGVTTLAGATESVDLPTTAGAYDVAHNGTRDGFVTRLSPLGRSLIYSTYFGGSHLDSISAIVLASDGAVTCAGWSGSPDLPTTPGAFDRTYNAGTDAFVARLAPDGCNLLYSTFIGGTGDDAAASVAIDAQGRATVVGDTRSPDFPSTVGAFDRLLNGPVDAFVTRLSADGSNLAFSTFLGGSDSDRAFAVGIDANGATTVVGGTWSFDFPTTPGAFDTTPNGRSDAFVARFSPAGAALVFSTVLGGGEVDNARGLVLQSDGSTTIVGNTASPTFPTTPGAHDQTFSGGTPGLGIGDGFVARLSPLGDRLRYSTFLGCKSRECLRGARNPASPAISPRPSNSPRPSGSGSPRQQHRRRPLLVGAAATTQPFGLRPPAAMCGGDDDVAEAVALDAAGRAGVVGWTRSLDFPTTSGGLQRTYAGSDDAFASKVDMLAAGLRAYGDSSPGCDGPLAIGASAMPRVGSATFALTCNGAAPRALGLLLASAGGLATPIALLSVRLWVDPAVSWSGIAVASNALGAIELTMPIPNAAGLVGRHVFAQFVWAGPGAPMPCPPLNLSASNALEITIQP